VNPTHQPPTPDDQLAFLDYIQRLLDGGKFSATYKFALLMALADLSVEQGDDSGAPLTIHTQDIAAKFVRYYSRQALPFPNGGGVLQQNRGVQAAVINHVAESAATYQVTAGGQHVTLLNDAGLVRSVAQTVRAQPLWKLQQIGEAVDDFLYPQVGRGTAIELRPGIAYCFRRFHGFVCRLAQDGWMRWIRESQQNQAVLGEASDLAAFMFGSERAPLGQYKPLLEDLQKRKCFYCGRGVGPAAHVDHFIPWSWYSLDLGHNFVLACQPCNGAKRDLLAAVRHLENWAERNDRHGGDMAAFFAENRLPCDRDGSLMVARWAYRRTELSRGLTWIGGQEFEVLRADWEGLLGVG
jgi:5-methylcytosine-specific restriction endonuclease McrA